LEGSGHFLGAGWPPRGEESREEWRPRVAGGQARMARCACGWCGMWFGVCRCGSLEVFQALAHRGLRPAVKATCSACGASSSLLHSSSWQAFQFSAFQSCLARPLLRAAAALRPSLQLSQTTPRAGRCRPHTTPGPLRRAQGRTGSGGRCAGRWAGCKGREGRGRKKRGETGGRMSNTKGRSKRRSMGGLQGRRVKDRLG